MTTIGVQNETQWAVYPVVRDRGELSRYPNDLPLAFSFVLADSPSLFLKVYFFMNL